MHIFEVLGTLHTLLTPLRMDIWHVEVEKSIVIRYYSWSRYAGPGAIDIITSCHKAEFPDAM